MTRKLQSILEMAVVIGGLVGTPVFVIAAFGLIDAVVQTDRVAAARVHETSSPGFQATDVKF